jgi:hypothetical protein
LTQTNSGLELTQALNEADSEAKMAFSVRDFLTSLHEGKYSFHGCYPKFWLASDGETLSYEACRRNVWQIARAIRDHDNSGWRVVECDVNWEDPEMYCAHTGARIESAYAETD